MNLSLKGYLYTLVSVLLISVTVIINSVSINLGINPEMAAFWMFLFASVFSFVMVIFMGKIDELLKSCKKYFKPLFAIGFFNGLAAVSFFISLSLMGPSLLTFILQFSAILIVALSVIFLKEKFIILEAVGGLIIIIGLIIITKSNGSSVFTGTLFAFGTVVFFSISQIIAKIYIKKVKPLYMNNIRLFFMTLTILIYNIITSSFKYSNLEPIYLLLIASIIGPSISFYLHYRSIEMAELSKVILIRSTEPFFVAVMSFFIIGEILTHNQMIGGFIMITGSMLIAVARYNPKLFGKWIPSIHLPFFFYRKVKQKVYVYCVKYIDRYNEIFRIKHR